MNANKQRARELVQMGYLTRTDDCNPTRLIISKCLADEIASALDDAEKRGQDTNQRRWEELHKYTFGYTIVERAMREASTKIEDSK